MKKSIKKTRQYMKNRTMRKARVGGLTPEERARNLEKIAELERRVAENVNILSDDAHYHSNREQREKQIDDILVRMREGQRNWLDR